MRTMEQDLSDFDFFAGLDQATLALLAGCAQNVRFAAGQMAFRAGEPADTFYVIRRGRLALELHSPDRGALTIETLDEGDVVGWSWLIPPNVWVFDGRAVLPTAAIALDGACLRVKCAEDPALAYQLLQRVAHVMYERLQAARIRLLDLYGGPP